MTDKIVVFVTVGSSQEAGALARSLVEKRLAACVSLLAGVASWYWWEDKVTEDQEVLLMMKTSRDKFAALEKEVLRLHSYAVPEVIALQIVEGSKNYLAWMEDSLKDVDG
ncbi:MAG: divalent-cation tolerance protein CutA [Acidobacteria bacterium]|nr:divalent-cation tolerance protein CutA [Acidobacteriota bacterium]